MNPRRRPLFCARGHRLLTEDTAGVQERTENCGRDETTGHHYCKTCKAENTKSWRRDHGAKPRKIKSLTPKK